MKQALTKRRAQLVVFVRTYRYNNKTNGRSHIYNQKTY